MRDRVVYKMLILLFKCRLRYDPKYISEGFIPISEITGRRKLRSSTNLYVPKSKVSSIGQSRFDAKGPRLWNSLPEGLRRIRKVKNFGKKLKTNLLKEY